MPISDKRKVNSVACNLTLARYWGTCGETILHAVEILKKNPGVSVEVALRTGFDRSVTKLLPPSHEHKNVAAAV